MHKRSEVAAYAEHICVPMLEWAAEQRLSRRAPTVIDHIGYTATLLEEELRPFWGITPLLCDGVDIRLHIRGETVPVVRWLHEVLVDGTNPDSPYSWDKYREEVGLQSFYFQNLTEVAGLLVGLFFARAQTWDTFSAAEQRQVADWVYNGCRQLCTHIAGNNHIWFPLLCLLVLKKFGYSYPETDRWLTEGMEKLDTMYLSDGWYSDGAFGRFDYYVAWSMHAYPLLWCLIEDDSFPGYAARRATYLHRTERFLQDYIHFFDRNGAHVPFGRSLSYRFAASCIFPLAVLNGAAVDPGLAKTITLRNITYFAEHVQYRTDGLLPAGYLYEAPALVENYTSDGGAYWCTKTFLCLLMDESHPFWTSEPVAIPADGDAYLCRPANPRIHLAVAGSPDGGVTVYNNGFQYYQFGRYCNPFNDMAGYYDKFAYNSLAGFALSTRDNTSCDNMISLSTADQSMASHRWGFTDLGEADGWMRSVHTPFSNDPDTRIHTWIRPLCGSLHVRIHRVVLAHPYGIQEGGFSVGMWNDFRIFGEVCGTFCVATRELVSAVRTVATVPVEYCVHQPQPGMHLLAPRAMMPTYRTAVLDPGIHWFASVFAISTDSDLQLPEIIRTESGFRMDGAFAWSFSICREEASLDTQF